jgi:excisionase family DNA binding protein
VSAARYEDLKITALRWNPRSDRRGDQGTEEAAVPEGTVVPLEPALLSVQQAAKYLSVGRTELFKMLKEGRIRSIRRGRRRLVPKAELDRFIREEVIKGQEK